MPTCMPEVKTEVEMSSHSGKSINCEVLITKINTCSGQFSYSMDTTQEVIKALLAKFNITDNPEKFVLFEKIEGPGKIGNCILIHLSQ